MTHPDWTKKLADTILAKAGTDLSRQEFLKANGDAIGRAVSGMPIHGGAGRVGVGGCVAINIASVHIPAFTASGSSYKNCYDLDTEAIRLGEAPKTSPKRLAVDQALADVHGKSPEQIYFAALELNGCGVGFYGDMCLVLVDDITTQEMRILDRNSYDLIRDPLKARIADRASTNGTSEEHERAAEARDMSGSITGEAAQIAAIKVLDFRPAMSRLVTTGAVSEGILDDEDYIEVLRPSTFAVGDVREVRLSPADIAQDERIRGRSLFGRSPSQTELLWFNRRRKAENRLHAEGVEVRVVTTAGRTKV